MQSPLTMPNPQRQFQQEDPFRQTCFNCQVIDLSPKPKEEVVIESALQLDMTPRNNEAPYKLTLENFYFEVTKIEGESPQDFHSRMELAKYAAKRIGEVSQKVIWYIQMYAGAGRIFDAGEFLIKELLEDRSKFAPIKFVPGLKWKPEATFYHILYNILLTSGHGQRNEHSQIRRTEIQELIWASHLHFKDIQYVLDALYLVRP